MQANQDLNLHFAPRLRTISLPPMADDGETFSLELPGYAEILPNDILLRIDDEMCYKQGLHNCLTCVETRRPVVGAEETVNTMLGLQEIITPATNPPNDRVTIEFVDGQIVTITPTEERTFVSVYDIKRAVVGLLEEGERGGVRLERWKALHSTELWNGSAVEVHVWMWRGLSRRSTADIWVLYL